MAQVLRNTGGDVLGWRASVIAVQVIGLKGLPVELRSGSFSFTAFTGSKPEYGEFACEFGGLSAGIYQVIPQGLGVSQTITVDGGGFALIEFAYRLPPTPTPIPPKVTWVGKVSSNSSGQGSNGISSVVVIKVLGAKGYPSKKLPPATSARGSFFIERNSTCAPAFWPHSLFPTDLTPSPRALYTEGGVGQYLQTLRVNFPVAPFAHSIGALPDLLQCLLNGFELAFRALPQGEVELPVIDGWIPFPYGVIGLMLQPFI